MMYNIYLSFHRKQVLTYYVNRLPRFTCNVKTVYSIKYIIIIHIKMSCVAFVIGAARVITTSLQFCVSAWVWHDFPHFI